MLEADKGRFPVRQCDFLRQEVTISERSRTSLPELLCHYKGGRRSTQDFSELKCPGRFMQQYGIVNVPNSKISCIVMA